MFPRHPFRKVNIPIFQLFAFLLFLAAPKHTHSWDIAVASDAGLTLLTLEGQIDDSPLVRTSSDSAPEMYALAYDPSMARFFFSMSNSNHSIYEFYLDTNVTKPLIPSKSEVQGLAYDTSQDMLYWTDGNGHTIRRLNLGKDGAQTEIVKVLPTQVPMGIAISYCHRAIFWANDNHTSASLDRADLDGSQHVQIVKQDLFQPLGVSVDEAYGKVYWTDDREGIYSRIERCNMDGSDRELVMQRTHEQPFGLALISSTIIWTDMINKNVWSLSVDMTFPNRTAARLEPGLLYRYQERPYGVTVNRNLTVSCEPVKELRRVLVDVTPKEESSLMVAEVCLNGGEATGDVCACKKGFSGKRCEIPICYQHCLHSGICYLDRHGYPDCQCQPGYEGRRCERDVCDEFCLGGGRCFVESGQPSCQCPAGTSGQRCEVSSSIMLGSAPTHDVPILAGLAALACTLVVVVAVLSWRVCVLKRRPRVKKRYIVNKRFRSTSGQTAMTSRPPPSPAVEQCEITIENCCNMNVCETPCFEPTLRTSKSSNKKTEDRRNLLSNMEEPGGSD